MNKKILKINLCLIMLFIFISCTAQVFAAGRFSLSKSSSSITEGKTDSFTINGSNATGRVDITSSNTSVATVECFCDTCLEEFQQQRNVGRCRRKTDCKKIWNCKNNCVWYNS